MLGLILVDLQQTSRNIFKELHFLSKLLSDTAFVFPGEDTPTADLQANPAFQSWIGQFLVNGAGWSNLSIRGMVFNAFTLTFNGQ